MTEAHNDTGYVFKKTVYGEFTVALVRISWDSESIVSMILSGDAVEELRFKNNLYAAVEQYNMFCGMAKKIADKYNRTSLYLRRRDEEKVENFNGI